MNWLKNKLREWLFPEYQRVCIFMMEMDRAKLKVKGKTINFQEPIVLIGDLDECKINIKPTIKPEIILSKLDFESLLSIAGHHHQVCYSSFDATKTKVKSK